MSDTFTDKLACPACARADLLDTSARTYVAPFNNKKYTLHRCKNCGLGFWTPLQIDPLFYEDEGFEAYSDYHLGERPFPPWCVLFFDKMAQRSGKLLDVGCGDGAFLARAKSFGFEVWGIDLDKNSVKAAKTRFGLDNVTHSSLQAFVRHCHEQGLTFDVITFFEVLEHQDKPGEFVEQVLSILNPGGHIAGSVPNGRRLTACLDRRISAGDLPPHHFLWFSATTVSSLLSRMRLSAILVYPSGNIPYAQLRLKLSAFLATKLFGLIVPTKAHWVLLAPAVEICSLLLWSLFKFAPAHLYFQAQFAARSR